jgi:H+/Cl- antiporter ClcA
VGLEKQKISWKMLLPSIVAASVGYTVFFALTGLCVRRHVPFPAYEGWSLIDLGYAVLLGLIGGAVGLLFIFLLRSLRRLSGRWASRP